MHPSKQIPAVICLVTDSEWSVLHFFWSCSHRLSGGFVRWVRCHHCVSAPLSLTLSPSSEALHCFPWAVLPFGGKPSPFSCANVSQSAPSNHSRGSSRGRARYRLNYLAAQCHWALGSQPSKVMTESAPQLPPIRSHYYLFTAPDSRQTKAKPSWDGNQSHSPNSVITHKKQHNNIYPKPPIGV